MNSKIKGIIVGVVVMVCLGATLLLLKLTDPAKNTDSSSQKDNTSSIADELLEDENVYPLTEIDKNSVSKITFVNEHGELVIERTEKAPSADGTAVWQLTNLDGVRQNKTFVNACVNICSGLKGREIVEENASDLSKYGLSEPKARITISSDNSPDRIFNIGIEIAQGGYYYLCEEGSNTVYTVLQQNVNYFMQSELYFTNSVLVDTPSDSAWPTIDRLTIKREDIDYDMVFVTVPEDEIPIGMSSNQAMIKPVYQFLNITASADVTHGIWGLTASEAVLLHPTDEDKEKYGLKEPFAKVILDTDSDDYTLSIGNPVYALDDNGEETTTVSGYYCFLNAKDTDCIYIIPATECVWATVVPGDIILGMMTNNLFVDLDTITLQTTDKTVSVDVYAHEDENPDDSIDDEVFEVKIDGKTVETELFQDWYVYWLECPTDETYFTPLTGEEELYLTVTIKLENGKEQIVKFYTSTNRRLIAELDGSVGYIIPTSYADTLMENIQRVVDGESMITTY